MFEILICEGSLADLAPTILSPYRYHICKTIDHFLDATLAKKFDLYLLHMECFEARRELYESGDRTSTIFIDEYYSINSFKKALSIGDDYILKPIYTQELQIRVAYHHRKLHNTLSNIIIYKDFYYHTNTQQLFFKTQKVKLSPNELKLVALFLSNQNKPISKDYIYEELESTSDGSLRVYISKLNKLGFEINYERSIVSYTLIA
jgi:DNA-binding response OmpR family regulator